MLTAERCVIISITIHLNLKIVHVRKIYTKGVFTVAEDYNKMIGTRVKMLRITKGISQTELAKKIGVTQTHLSNIENGRAGLTIPNLIKLHEALDTSISSFFEDIEGKPEEEKKSEVTLEDLTELLHLLKAGKN